MTTPIDHDHTTYADPVAILADTIFLTVSGSRAYGTSNAESDTDRRGIFVCRNIWHYAGLELSPLTHRNSWPWFDTDDTTVYECRHAMRLMANSNLTAIEMLYTDSKHWMITSPAWDLMVEHRQDFLSKHLYLACRGFASKSMERMSGSASSSPHGKRHRLIEKFGYDTKAAAHALRITAMCRDLYRDGTLTVTRPAAECEHLIKVREGRFTAAEVLQEHADLEAGAAESFRKSDMPSAVNQRTICDLWRQVFNLQMGGAW